MSNKSSMDARRRRVFLKKMCINILYKSISENQTLPYTYRQFYNIQYNGKKYSSTRIRNRCILTGRSRGIYKFCKLSRIKLREYASAGLLMGISKYSW